MRWSWLRWGDLGREDLYDALALRGRVFVVEQTCPYLDVDGLDRDAWHLLGRDDAGVLLAYLRAVDPGLKYAEPAIGRVVTAPEARGGGVGHALMAEGVARCGQVWPGQPIRISAQAHLQGYYARHGFATVGEPYLEDDIPHVEMLRRG